MRKWMLIFSYIVLGLPAFSYSLVKQEVNTTMPLKCSFSKRHYNRVVVEEGSVDKVLVPEGYFSIHTEEESGQVFMLPMYEFGEEVTVSVVTGSGLIQDLEVVLEDKSSEVVLLKEPKKESKSSEESILKNSKDYDQAVGVLKSLLKNDLPDGYVARVIEKQKKRSILNGRIQFTEKYLIEGPFENIRVYDLSNSGVKPCQVSEKLFAHDFVKWIYLDKKKLESGDQTFMVIGEEKNVF